LSIIGKVAVKEKVVEVEYPDIDGFILDLCFLDRETIKKMMDRVTTKKLNRKTRQMDDVIDNDKFIDVYVDKVIRGWRGLYIRDLKKLMPVDILQIPNPDDEIVFSKEEAIDLVKNSALFEQWINEVMTDIDTFNQEEREEEEKNSKPTSNSN